MKRTLLFFAVMIAFVSFAAHSIMTQASGGIEVGASENNLQINFFSVGEKEKIKYQYKAVSLVFGLMAL